jgi:hypothetical protein
LIAAKPKHTGRFTPAQHGHPGGTCRGAAASVGPRKAPCGSVQACIIGYPFKGANRRINREFGQTKKPQHTEPPGPADPVGGMGLHARVRQRDNRLDQRASRSTGRIQRSRQRARHGEGGATKKATGAKSVFPQRSYHLNCGTGRAAQARLLPVASAIPSRSRGRRAAQQPHMASHTALSPAHFSKHESYVGL